jgi:hypothetical protein
MVLGSAKQAGVIENAFDALEHSGGGVWQKIKLPSRYCILGSGSRAMLDAIRSKKL